MGYDLPPRFVQRWLLHVTFLPGHPHLRQPRRRARHTADRADPRSRGVRHRTEQPARPAVRDAGPASRAVGIQHSRAGHVQRRIRRARLPAAGADAADACPVHPAAGHGRRPGSVQRRVSSSRRLPIRARRVTRPRARRRRVPSRRVRRRPAVTTTSSLTSAAISDRGTTRAETGGLTDCEPMRDGGPRIGGPDVSD